MQHKRGVGNQRMNFCDARKIDFGFGFIKPVYRACRNGKTVDMRIADKANGFFRLRKQSRHIIDFDIVFFTADISEFRFNRHAVLCGVFDDA